MNGLIVLHQSRQPRPKQMAMKKPISYPVPSSWANAVMRPPVTKPGPNLTSGLLSGIWDDITALVSQGAQKLESSAGDKLKSTLDTQLANLKAKVGTFLTTQQTLMNLQTRANAQKGSSDSNVASRATAISAQITALLNNYNNIESQATTLAGNLTDLKTQIDQDPVFQNFDPSSMGTEIVSIYNNYVDKVSSAASQSVATINAMDQHIAAVNQVSSDVQSLENLAQGKGFQSLVSGFGSSLATNALKPAVMIGAAALAVYLLAPSFIGRMARK